MVETATAEDVRQSIERDTAGVVDVLAAEDHEDEHIPGTTTIPYDEVEDRFPEEFDRSDDIIVYRLAESCRASPEAAATPGEMGFANVRDYEVELIASPLTSSDRTCTYDTDMRSLPTGHSTRFEGIV